MENNYSTETIKTLITLLEATKESNSDYREKYMSQMVDLEYCKSLIRMHEEIISRKDKKINRLFFSFIALCISFFISYFYNG